MTRANGNFRIGASVEGGHMLSDEEQRRRVAEAIVAKTSVTFGYLKENAADMADVTYSRDFLEAAITMGLRAFDNFDGVSMGDAVDIGAAFFWQATIAKNPHLESHRQVHVREPYLEHQQIFDVLLAEVQEERQSRGSA